MVTAAARKFGTQARTPTLSLVHLWEDVRRINGPLKVDADKGVIYGVKVLGWDSANGRRYLPEAAQKALSLYEGAKVFTNHPDPTQRNRPRLDGDGFGRLKDVHWKPDGLYGDLHYFKAHPMANTICEDVSRAIGFFGLSHNADGKSIRDTDGIEVIQEITAVRSVDIVTDAATTSNLWESRRVTTTAAGRITFRKLMEHALLKGAYKRKLREAMDDGMVQPDMETDEPDETEAPAMGADDAVDAAFNAALHGIVDDTGLDSKAKAAKLKQLLSIQEKLAGKKTAESDTSDDKKKDDADTSKKEGKTPAGSVDPAVKQLQEQIAALTRKTTVRQACDAASFIPTPVQLRALEAVGEKDMDDLIESFQATNKADAGGSAAKRLSFTPQTPKTSGTPVTEGKAKPVTEAKGDAVTVRKSRTSFLRTGAAV